MPPVELEIPQAEIPQDVLSYCSREGLLLHLRSAILLVLDVYDSVVKIVARIQQDPEVDKQRVILDATVHGGFETVLAQKKEFTQRWISSTPSDVRDRIRVLYHLT